MWLEDLAARSGVSREPAGRRQLDRLWRNSCLNDVLARRIGIPITLSLVMMQVGRRLGPEIAGIGLPGHFVVAGKAQIAGRVLRNRKGIYAKWGDWAKTLTVIDGILAVAPGDATHPSERETVLGHLRRSLALLN